jgi:hypothetical protein
MKKSKKSKPAPVPLITPEIFAQILAAIVSSAERDREQAKTAR